MSAAAGIVDLLVDPETATNPREIAETCSSARQCVLPGLAAIGELLAAFAQDEEELQQHELTRSGLSKATLARIGWHIKYVAELVDRLMDMEADADCIANRARPTNACEANHGSGI
jgi:hypothetical protein